jgi:hypothetical protein
MSKSVSLATSPAQTVRSSKVRKSTGLGVAAVGVRTGAGLLPGVLSKLLID